MILTAIFQCNCEMPKYDVEEFRRDEGKTEMIKLFLHQLRHIFELMLKP